METAMAIIAHLDAARRQLRSSNPSTQRRNGIVGMYHHGMTRPQQIERAAQMLAAGYSLAFVMNLMRPR
jgi:hypothetical protein